MFSSYFLFLILFFLLCFHSRYCFSVSSNLISTRLFYVNTQYACLHVTLLFLILVFLLVLMFLLILSPAVFFIFDILLFDSLAVPAVSLSISFSMLCLGVGSIPEMLKKFSGICLLKLFCGTIYCCNRA